MAETAERLATPLLSGMASGAMSDQDFVAWLERQWAVPAVAFRVEVEGAAIACRGWNLEARELPGLVLVHGFRAHSHWWDHIAPTLARRHRVVALDLSGMGDSDTRPAYARAQHGREVMAVAAACGLERPVVVAHSYGGLCAMVEAVSRPDGMARLVVIDSALPLEGVRQVIRAQAPRSYPDAETAIGRFRLIPAAHPHPRLADYVARHSIRETPQGWTWKFDTDATLSLNEESTFGEALRNIRTPSSFFHGALSPVVTPERLARLPIVLPTVERPVTIPAAHHHVPLEQPLALLDGLVAVLVGPTP